jgi:CRISP-associated protein Cas1
MRHIQNTLYVSQDGAYLHKDGESIVVRHEKQKIGQFPIIAIGEVVCFGFGVSVSAPLAEHCALNGITVTYLNGSGRFLARMVGPLRGNVLLRRQQYRDADDENRALDVAKCCVAAKVLNQRSCLQRFLRNHSDAEGADELQVAVTRLGVIHKRLGEAPNRDILRGHEGDAASTYFGVFDKLILSADPQMRFGARNRRPPTDRVNALLSFAYSLLALDLRSALEAVGLDPYVGFLHVERPGRPSLALDLAEEFRAPFADRLVLSLVNLRQVNAAGFSVGAAGEVTMDTPTRKAFLASYQARKRETIRHPFLDEDMELGLAFLAQARLLARFVRGDLDLYPAFIWR